MRVTASASFGVGILAVGVAIAGVVGVYPPPGQATAAWDAGPLAGALPTPLSPSASKAPAPPTNGVPTAIRIPRISVHASLEQLSIRGDGSLSTPSFSDAGWYAGGTAPGDIGPAVIAGHIDSTSGPSVFYQLNQLHAGDLVEVQRGGRWLRFTVTAVHRYPKSDFPTAEVYGPTPTAELRLITCGGAFNSNRLSYDDNVVVFARETA